MVHQHIRTHAAVREEKLIVGKVEKIMRIEAKWRGMCAHSAYHIYTDR